MQRINPVECAMLFGVAVVVTAVVVSTLAAVIVDAAYQAIAERRWRAVLPLVAIVSVIIAVATVVSYGSPVG